MDDEHPSKRPRVRQACQACRDAKLRCDLGEPGKPKDPPCHRCSRSGRECKFVGSHLHHKPRKMTRRKSTVHDDLQPKQPGQHSASPSLPQTSPSTIPPPTSAHGTSTSPRTARMDSSGAGRSPYRGGISFGSTLETPADALRILCAAADEREAIADEPVEYVGPQDSKVWNRWGPVRDGLLTTEEAGSLLNFYAKHLGPMHTVVPIFLFQPENFTVLLNEPVLLTAICLTASRFVDLGPSFDAAEPSRSKVIQTKLVSWLLSRLGYMSMGDPTFRTIGTVEALLVLSEWPPRALLLKDPVGHTPTASSLSSACKLFDDLSWTLTGLALRIAQELSLQDQATYTFSNSSIPVATTQRRIDAWINCLSADRHVSVRLGRVSLVQEMSTNWWEGLSHIIFVPLSDSILRHVSDPAWRDTQAISELTHLIGLLQELLYATPELTADLIRTRRFEPLLHRLKPELDSIAQWINPETITYNVLDESVPGMESQEIREILMRVEIDYVRLYANAISMRAAHARLSHRLIESHRDRPFLDGQVLRWAEAPFLLEVVHAAISLMGCGVALQKRKVLRYCPGRTFLRMMFASVFLMKAMSFGAVIQPETDVVSLQYSLIDAFRQAAVDDDHIAMQLASLLSRLFPPPPSRTEESSQADCDLDPLALLNFDLAGVDVTSFGDMNADLNNAGGFNPNGLVSFIEAMLDSANLEGDLESAQAAPQP